MASLLIPNDSSVVKLRRDLVAEGFTDDDIRGAIRRGDLERVCRGAVGAPIRESDENVAAQNRYIRRVIARGRGLHGAVISHVSAAALYRLPVPLRLMEVVHATRPGRGGSRKPDGLNLHAAQLFPYEIDAMEDVRVTSVARTVIDVARSVPLHAAVALADEALNRRLVRAGELAEALRWARCRRGLPAAKRALRLVDGRSESVGETEMRLTIGGLGLPPLALQCNVYSSDGRFLGRCDGAYPESAVLVEFDGLKKYRALLRPGEDAADVVIREKRREELLTEAGFVVVRVTWSDLRDPIELRRRLVHAIARGKRAVSAGSVTGRCVPGASEVVPF